MDRRPYMSDPACMSHLVACAGCERHVRTSETLCPFCGDVLPLSLRTSAAPPVPTRRLGRAAIFAFGTALAAATGCGESHTGDDAGPEDAGPEDAGLADAGSDAGFDAGEIFPPYGAPPADTLV